MAANTQQARRVGLIQALRYRGQESMLTWILHRLTGLGILLFVSVHVVAAFFLNVVSPQTWRAITDVYESKPIQIFVYFCVLYHALNGLRLILEDFFPPLLRFHREMIWIQWLLFVPIFGLPAVLMLQDMLAAGM
jgi:succinate dehydrogenase / fumarate reductase cytochrome b subunit